ncbi:MAG: glycosyltransferase [Parcubacteria group bacterium]|nr:glycosyltransferase [Parcubacteria group bacterium]
MPKADYPRVSFVIPTLNAAGILPRCLRAIRKQKYPRGKVEIIISDGGSTDQTVQIAKTFRAKVIQNPEILHEPGKTRGAAVAHGDIIFFTDADNILSDSNWLLHMTDPYRDDPNILGFLPQTLPPPDSNSLDRYLGYLCTDPFTWFVYGNAANPKDYSKIYLPIQKTKTYLVYRFTSKHHPLFGFSQGVGMNKIFQRDGIGAADDILGGIKLIAEGGKIAYIPKAGVYHYHVSNLGNFIRKYRWRVRNNVRQKVKNMGLINRMPYMTWQRKIRMAVFIPYTLSLMLPTFDAIRLFIRYKDPVLFWHVPACLLMALLIIYESTVSLVFSKLTPGTYE